MKGNFHRKFVTEITKLNLQPVETKVIFGGTKVEF